MTEIESRLIEFFSTAQYGAYWIHSHVDLTGVTSRRLQNASKRLQSCGMIKMLGNGMLATPDYKFKCKVADFQ